MNGFIYVDKNENPDFAIRRSGAFAGLITEYTNKNTKSHYFIKLMNQNRDVKQKFYLEFSKMIFGNNILKSDLTFFINKINTPRCI